MDIDIDFQTTFDPTTLFPQAVRASMLTNNHELKPHPCGMYFQTVPTDKAAGTSLSAIPYKDAIEFGAMKIDFLHLSILDQYSSKQEMREVLDSPVNWELFEHREIVEQLFQLRNHYDIVSQIKPTSVIELADCIAIIRPNKRFLLQQYLANREQVRPLLYRQQDDDKSAFRKSHAISYALTIILQLHKLQEI